MQARVLVIGGILEQEQQEALDKIFNEESIDLRYLTDTQIKNGKKLTEAVLDKYDSWVFKKAPTPVKLRNMLDETAYEKIVFVPVYKDKVFSGYQKIVED